MLEIKRTLNTERLTKARLVDLRPDEVITAFCAPDAAAWKTAERIAYNVKKDYSRPDGRQYVVASSAANMTVTVSLI
ncbi:MAG: hypothetical protein U0L43_03115 [Muribaculaceae bacterium]|nr:hypothetical protein [Muribaculaceae bacterium]